MKKLKVLIACEFSGVVRNAFNAAGHYALSCDLLPTSSPGDHYQGDVFDIINDGFDLMIAHPPCTYLTFAANAYWDEYDRSTKRIEALDFFNRLWLSPIPHICLENPLGIASSVIKKESQIIHPYYFGDQEMKKTCLWLKNLPKLVHIRNNDLFSDSTYSDIPKPVYTDYSGKKDIKLILFHPLLIVVTSVLYFFLVLLRQWRNNGLIIYLKIKIL